MSQCNRFSNRCNHSVNALRLQSGYNRLALTWSGQGEGCRQKIVGDASPGEKGRK
jgi:hypothetical protein